MVKRWIVLCLALLMLLALTACGNSSGANSAVGQSSAAGVQQTEAPSGPAEETEASSEASEEPAEATNTQPTESASLVTDGGTEISLSALAHFDESGPAVYFVSELSPEGLQAVYDALQWEPTGNLAVKVSTGEPPSSNYLRQELIGELVSSLSATYVECMTAYGGQRSSAAMAKQVAEDHGFAPFELLDENGSLELPVKTYHQIDTNYVGAGMANYDSMLVLSHFKGHAMAGFGGAIKNISIGLGSVEGKNVIHTSGQSHTNWFGGDQTAFTESMAEAGSTVADYYGDKIIYINVMNRLSVDCDCNGNPAEPDMHDIGILASTDPVALDQACVDLVYAVPDGDSLIRRMESRSAVHTLEHAEEIGLGSRSYRLVVLNG